MTGSCVVLDNAINLKKKKPIHEKEYMTLF